MVITCWGSRGSIPVSGKSYIKYGGDTTCMTIHTDNDEIIIVDGSGGNVFINPSESTLMDYMERQVQFESFLADIARSSHQPDAALEVRARELRSIAVSPSPRSRP